MVLLKLKNILILGIIVFLIMSFWGLYSMPIDESGKMVNCPFRSNSTSFCQINLTEHISQWQQIFTATLQKAFFLNSFILIISFAFAFIAFTRYLLLISFGDFVYKFYFKQKHYLSFFDHLKEAFSQGILNPKIYSFIN